MSVSSLDSLLNTIQMQHGITELAPAYSSLSSKEEDQDEEADDEDEEEFRRRHHDRWVGPHRSGTKANRVTTYVDDSDSSGQRLSQSSTPGRGSTPSFTQETCSWARHDSSDSPSLSEGLPQASTPIHTDLGLPWEHPITLPEDTTNRSPEQLATEWTMGDDASSQAVGLGGWGTTVELPWTKSRMNGPKSSKCPSYSIDPANSDKSKEDGWGIAKNYVQWGDLRTQGFAYEVLQEQKNTAYWALENGVWRRLDIPGGCQPMAPLDGQPSSSAAPPTPTPPSLEPSAQASEQWSQAQQQIQEAVSDEEVYLSSDESIDWDDDDGVTIRTDYDASAKSTKPAPSVQGLIESPVHLGRPKWATRKEWQMTRPSSAVEAPVDNQRRFGLTNDSWDGPTTTAMTEKASRAEEKTKSPVLPTHATGGLGDWQEFALANTTKKPVMAMPPTALLIDTSDDAPAPTSSELVVANGAASFLWASLSTFDPLQPSVRNSTSSAVDEFDILTPTPVVLPPSRPPTHENDSVKSHTPTAIMANNATPLTQPDPPSDNANVTTPTPLPASSKAAQPQGPGKRLVSLSIETVKYGLQKLQLYENQDPRQDVKDYCERFEMQEHEEKIYESAISTYMAKKTERLLARKKKEALYKDQAIDKANKNLLGRTYARP